MSEPAAFEYWAFISYSHQDRKWGDWLHRALESYRVPARLVGRAGRDGAIPRHLRPVFRDREELPTASDLGAAIEEALARSRYLVVICSPRSARSRWVNEEVLAFKRLGRSDRILALIADGEPNATDAPGRAEQECFPDALRRELAPSGELGDARCEPIAADARPGGDGRHDARLKLIAGLLGVGFDELKQRELQRRQRRLLALTGVALALTLAMAALAGWAVLAEREADRRRGEAEAARGLAERREAEAKEQRRRAEQSAEALRRSEYATRIALAAAKIDALAVEPARGELLACPEDLRGWEWAHLWLRTDQSIATLEGEGGGFLNAVAFAPDGERVAVGGLVGSAWLWNVETGEALPLSGHSRNVASVAFDARGELLATASYDGTAILRNARTGEPIRRLSPGAGALNWVGLTPDGALAITAPGSSADGRVRVWRTETGAQVRELAGRFGGEVTASVSSDGERIAIATDRAAEVWSLITGERLSRYGGHRELVWSVAFSPDGATVASAGDDGQVHLWRAADGEPIRILGGHDGRVTSLAFDPAGRRLASVGHDRAVRVWDRTTGEPLVLLRGHTKPITAVAFDRAGEWLATAGQDATARVWDSRRGREVEVAVAAGGPIDGVEPQVNAARLTQEGTIVYALGSVNLLRQSDPIDTVRVRAPGSSRDALSIPGNRGGSTLAATGLRGEVIVSAGIYDSAVIVWDARTGERLRALAEHAGGVTAMAVSPDGTRLASAGKGEDGFAVWDLRTGERIGVARGEPMGDVLAIALGPRGDLVATGGTDDLVRLWSLDPAEPIAQLDGQEGDVHALAFDPSGRRLLAGGSGGAAVLHDVERRAVERVLRGHDARIWSVAFSPDGERAVTGDQQGAIKLWDTRSGRELLTLSGHTAPVTSLELTPDGARLMSASRDGTVRLWVGVVD